MAKKSDWVIASERCMQIGNPIIDPEAAPGAVIYCSHTLVVVEDNPRTCGVRGKQVQVLRPLGESCGRPCCANEARVQLMATNPDFAAAAARPCPRCNVLAHQPCVRTDERTKWARNERGERVLAGPMTTVHHAARYRVTA